MNNLPSIIQNQFDQIFDPLFSCVAEERLIQWEETATKIAKYAGFALLTMCGAVLVVADSFPALLSLYSSPLFIITSVMSTAFLVYTLYQRKLVKIRKDSDEQIRKFAASTIPLPADTEKRLKFMGSETKVLELDNCTVFSELDSAEKTVYLGNIFKFYPQLRDLTLRDMEVDDAVDLKPLESLGLEKLTLVNCTLNDTQLGVFGANPKLKSLFVQKCHKISEAAFRAFDKSPIEEFELVNCRLDPTLDVKKAKENALKKLSADPNKMMENFANKEKFIDEELGMTHVAKEKFSFIHSWKELKTLTVSHIDDDGVSALYPALPKLETLQIEHSSALTGECFYKKNLGSLKHLILKKCYNLKVTILSSLCAQNSLEKVSFACDPAKLIGLTSTDHESEYETFRQFFKAPDKMENTFVGTWVRKK